MFRACRCLVLQSILYFFPNYSKELFHSHYLSIVRYSQNIYSDCIQLSSNGGYLGYFPIIYLWYLFAIGNVQTGPWARTRAFLVTEAEYMKQN